MASYPPEISVDIRRSSAPWVLVLLLAAACSPKIGDDCGNALDCSASGMRLCDSTQRNGYCTLDGCEEGTCPEESVCVQFGRQIDDQPVDRLSRTFCMAKCDKDSDCRNDEGYRCFNYDAKNAPDFGAEGESEATVLGGTQGFCALPASGKAQ
ncbi:MAG TPA: hypothetical protein VJR89_22880 [Polyangiales bacterium]|nr:hypothetical protein [Polyangiales bacterium]